MDKRTVRLVLGKTADGQEVLSPPVRWQGTGAGAFKMHATPADNEQMVLHSPSGTIGNGSMAHWGTYDQDNPPPSKNKDEVVLEYGGKAKVTFGKDYIEIRADDKAYVKIKHGDDGINVVPGKHGFVTVGDPSAGDDVLPVMLIDGSPAKNLKAAKA